MKNTQQIQPTRISYTQPPIIEYSGKRVITLSTIDELHQRPKRTASRNFHKNRKHFIEGEDYFKISPDEIRPSYPNALPAKLHSLVHLMTDTGYLMLTKSLTDDLSWDVQRKLVRGYFNQKEDCQVPVKPHCRTKPQKRLPKPASYTASFIEEFNKKEMPDCLTQKRMQEVGDPVTDLLDALATDGHDVNKVRKFWRAKEDLISYHRILFSNMRDQIWTAQTYPAARVDFKV
jgi:hypothetical protein